jgi:hypothetical protein
VFARRFFFGSDFLKAHLKLRKTEKVKKKHQSLRWKHRKSFNPEPTKFYQNKFCFKKILPKSSIKQKTDRNFKKEVILELFY